MIRTLVGLVVAAAMLAGTGAAFTSSASAVAASSQEQVVYLNKIEKGTNARCPQVRPVKMFRVNLKVQKGERIKSFGPFSLRVDGRDRFDSGSRVNKRFVEFYYDVKPGAKVGRNLARSFGYAELSPGSNPRAVVEKLCFSRGT